MLFRSRITVLNIQEGKTVEKGALIAKLFDGDLLAQLKKLEVQLQLAQKTEERQSQLLRVQGISQQDYDISLLQVNNLKADIGIIKTNLDKTEIRAPFKGKMGLKNLSVGAYVTPATLITSINQTDILKVDFTVPEKYTSKIKNGQHVQTCTNIRTFLRVFYIRLQACISACNGTHQLSQHHCEISQHRRRRLGQG